MNLEERLRERIRREGPISFYEWMKAALYDERDGYYCADRVRQGRTGDYRTAPETSSLFAATFANYFAKLFAELGSPNRFTVIEVGAGSGEFALGVLKTLKSEHPQMFSATNYVIEEISERTRAQVAARLSQFANRASVRSPSVSDSNVREVTVSDGRVSDTITGIVFSNELIDAFPVNRVVKRNGHLHQLYVGLEQDVFTWVEGELDKPVADYCERTALDLREGQIAEINLTADAFIARSAARLEGGYVITVDYGAERNELLNVSERGQGTLRGFRRHQFADDVLAQPGQRDLTTTIDWTQVAEAGERAGLKIVRFEQLDHFLIAEGLLELISQRTQSTTDMAEAARLTTSARELILPNGMAASYQVMVQERRP